jgi:hypothetical protein
VEAFNEISQQTALITLQSKHAICHRSLLTVGKLQSVTQARAS